MKGSKLSEVSQADPHRNVSPGAHGWRVKERKSGQSIELMSRRPVPVLKSKSVSPDAETMAGSGRASVRTSPGGPRRPAGRVVRKSLKEQPIRNGRRLGRAACAVAVMITAVAVLTMAGPLWQWSGFGGSSRSGVAEAHLSSASASDQGKSAMAPSRESIDQSQPAPREVIGQSDAEAALLAMKTLVAARTSSIMLDEQHRTSASGDGYQLYFGAYRKEIDARYVWAGFQADLGPLLGQLTPEFERIQDKNGTAYRILAGTIPSLDDADGLCARLKDRNIACSIVRR